MRFRTPCIGLSLNGRRNRWFADSPLERAGFEPSVPGESGFDFASEVRGRLFAGGKWIRTIGPPPEIVVDPSGSRRDYRAKCGCLSARPRVRCLCPPGKTQHLLPKSVFDRPGSWHRPLFLTRDRWFESSSLQQRESATNRELRRKRAKLLRRTLTKHYPPSMALGLGQYASVFGV